MGRSSEADDDMHRRDCNCDQNTLNDAAADAVYGLLSSSASERTIAIRADCAWRTDAHGQLDCHVLTEAMQPASHVEREDSMRLGDPSAADAGDSGE